MKRASKLFLLLQGLFLSFSFTPSINNLNQNENHFTYIRKEASSTPESYFADIEAVAPTLTRQQLFDRLQAKVWNGWKRQGYEALNSTFLDTDFVDGYLVDMYSNISKLRPGDTGNYSKEGDAWNKEHLIPKSWWGGSKGGPNGEGGDMFNMYPTDGKINGMRSNFALGVTSSPTTWSENKYSKLGNSSFHGYTGTVFEPNDEWKGNIARSYFYFALKYVTKTSSNYTQGNGVAHFKKDGNFGLTTYSTNLFLEWNKHLEKNQYEKERCERVYLIQNNRNPFIYHPEWADYIWGNKPLTSIEPTSISLDETSSRIRVGSNKTLKCTILPENANKSVTWYSSDSNIASVDETGLVTAKSIGKCQITVTSKIVSSLSAKAEIEVHNDKVDLISISLPSSITLSVGEEKIIEPNFVPADASNKEFSLSIEDNSIAKITSNKIIALKDGNTTLTATSNENPSIKASTNLVVTSTKYYSLVKSTSELKQGKKIIIGNKDKCVVATTFDKTFLNSSKATYKDEIIEEFDKAASIFTVGVNPNGTYTLSFPHGDKLSSSAAKSLSINGDNVNWNIKIDGIKSIITNEAYPNNPLLYNVGSPRFKTYDGSNDSLLYPSIYIEPSHVEPEPPSINIKEEASKYATSFLEKTSTACEQNNVPSSLWEELKNDYLNLDDKIKNYIKSNSETSELNGFITRYNFIAKKYGYEDFIFNHATNASPSLAAKANSSPIDPRILIVLILVVSTGIIVFAIKLIKTKKY